MPNLGILERFDSIKINEYFLRSLNVDLTAKGSCFLVSLGAHRTNAFEMTVYLGCLETDLFQFLDRITSKSNVLFEQYRQNSDKKRIMLIVVQLDNLVGYRDFTCVTPLTKEHDMLRNESLYKLFDKYISCVYALQGIQANLSISFSCLPLLDGRNKAVDAQENIFIKFILFYKS